MMHLSKKTVVSDCWSVVPNFGPIAIKRSLVDFLRIFTGICRVARILAAHFATFDRK